jgi:hypothetical protein
MWRITSTAVLELSGRWYPRLFPLAQRRVAATLERPGARHSTAQRGLDTRLRMGEGRADMGTTGGRPWEGRLFVQRAFLPLSRIPHIPRFKVNDAQQGFFKREEVENVGKSLSYGRGPERLFHDLRRTAVRNMIRANAPEGSLWRSQEKLQKVLENERGQ